MPFSPAALRDSLRAFPVEKWRWLIRADMDNPPPESGIPIQWINDTVPLDNAEGRWEPVGRSMEVQWVSAEEGRPPRARVRIANVPDLMQELLRFQESLLLTIRRVILSEPDVAQLEITNATMIGFDYNALEINGSIGFDEMFESAYPKDVFAPATTPAIFGRVDVSGSSQ